MKNIVKANTYVKEHKDKVNPRYRHKYHYMSEVGWINDPNGFSVFNGAYHLFAQHYPYESKWGPMHWCHATTKDFVKWEHQPIALAPEKDYEMDLGCFSGTALEYDGKHILMYTSAKGKFGEPPAQEQCVAIGDGIHYEKLEANPVITEKDLPEFATNEDSRDPKIIRRDGMFYCFLAVKDRAKEVGVIVLYKSTDLMKWDYVGEVLRGNEKLGNMFECPDIFTIGDKDVIITSPMRMPRQKEKYHNYCSTVYFVGKMDYETGNFHVEHYDEIDGGFDFYAPQTVTKPDGEVVMIGWHQMWERYFVTGELGHNWAGAMSIPRQLRLERNALYQAPVDALTQYMGQKTDDIAHLSQDCYRLKIKADLNTGNTFKLSLLKTSTGSFDVIFDKEANQLIIDRSKSAFNLDRHESEEGVNNVRKVTLAPSSTLELDILVDISSIEIFVNAGERVLSSNYYTTDDVLTTILDTDYTDLIVEKWNIEM